MPGFLLDFPGEEEIGGRYWTGYERRERDE